MVVGFVLIVATIASAVSGASTITTLSLVVLFGLPVGIVLGMILVVLTLPLKARRAIRKQRALQHDVEISWNDQGASTRSLHGGATVPWEDFLGWKENNRVVLLYISESQFYVVPKRAFVDAASLEAFRELVARRIRSGP